MRTTFRLFLLVILLLSVFAFTRRLVRSAESPYPPCLPGGAS